MLRLIFYKNCIMNNKYQNIISPVPFQAGESNTFLYQYLLTLDKKTIDLANVYYENTGELIFEQDLLVNPYEYNYMQAIQLDEDNLHVLFKKYCFIKKIQLKNGCAYVEYEEDVISTYLNDVVDTQDCLLINSRLCNYKNNQFFTFKRLPVEFDSNNILDINFSGQLDSDVQIIMELQLYDLINPSAGIGSETDNRESFICLFYDVERTSGSDHLLKRYFTKSELQPVLETILKWVSAPNPHISNIFPGDSSTGAKYFDIGNIIVVPRKFDIDNLFNLLNYDFSNHDWFFYNNFYSGAYPRFAFQKAKVSNTYKKLTINSGTITENFKKYSFGTYTTQIPISHNGTSIPYKVYASIGQNNFDIILGFQNKEIDITKDFLFNIHYDLISSTENSQRKIALQMKNNSIETSIEKITAGGIRGGFQILSGVGETIMGSEGDSASMMSKGINDIGYGIINTAENLAIKTKLDQAKVLNNTPRFATSKGNFTHEVKNCNYYYGLLTCSITPDNTDYVSNSISNVGMRTYEYVGISSYYTFKDIFKSTNAIALSAKYDYVKFESPNVYGPFSNEIAEKINQILSSGVKIWYSSTFTSDTYNNNFI